MLHVVEGPDAGQRFPLPDREPQLIGRSTEALPISDPSVSRRHAELTPDDGRWWLRDLESTNGTYLNDTMIVGRAPVSAGDRIQCGDTVLAMLHEHEDDRTGAVRAIDPERASVELLPFEATPQAESAVLASIIEIATTTDDEEHALEGVCLEICRRFQADRTAVLKLHGDASSTGTQVARDPDGNPPEQPVSLPRTLLRSVHASRMPGQARVQEDPIRIVACIPLLDRDTMLGVLVLERDRDVAWRTAELDTLQAAGRIIGLALGVLERTAANNRTKRLAAMGEAIAALSHSIKNILQGLRGGADAVELAIRRQDLAMADQGWPILARNLDRILSLTMNMLAYSKERALDFESLSLGLIAGEIRDLLMTKATHRGVRIELEVDPEEPPIPLDPDAIHQALVNLLDNAIEACPDQGGQVVMRTGFDPDDGLASITISDNGPGIASADQDRIFDPFTSSKGQRGTGLGLTVTRKLVQQHGGRVEVVEPELGGATLLVELPSSRADEPDASRTRGPRPLPGGDMGIEFAED
ncbi:MAG: ATP-binding protein [Phycisphaerales bacterium]|nr:ATP-binding protein [Phycisphaerales bacterium]